MDQPTVEPQASEETKLSRRRLLKIAAATGGAVAASTLIPSKWAKPVVEVGLLPAHAQVSRWITNLRGRDGGPCDGDLLWIVEFDYCIPAGGDGLIDRSFSGGVANGEGYYTDPCNGVDELASLADAEECGHYCEEICIDFGDREKFTFTVTICDEGGHCETRSISVNSPS